MLTVASEGEHSEHHRNRPDENGARGKRAGIGMLSIRAARRNLMRKVKAKRSRWRA